MEYIVRGQKINPAKLQFASELRGRMTEEETILWGRLRAHRFEGLHFRRQQVFDGYIVDFYCHAARLIVEVDGPIHDWQVEEDRYRDKVLEQRGLRVLRIRNQEIRQNLDGVLERISSHLTHT